MKMQSKQNTIKRKVLDNKLIFMITMKKRKEQK